MTEHIAALDSQLVAWVVDGAQPFTAGVAGDGCVGTTDAAIERHFPTVAVSDDLVVDWQLPQLAD
jgi:hypothetical protein